MRLRRPPVCRLRHLVPLLGLLALLAAPPALAARFHVQVGGLRDAAPSVPGDWSPENCYPDLTAALTAVAAGDTILFAREDHAVEANLAVADLFLGDRDLAATPFGARLLLGPEGSLVLVAAGSDLRLRGLEFVPGAAERFAPAIVVFGDGASLQIDGCHFTELTALGSGGSGGAALRVLAAATVNVTTCRFEGNATAGGRGGAVFLGAGVTATFTDCVLSGNRIAGTDPRGGAVMIDGRSALSTATFTRCLFAGNISGGPGGALSTLSAAVTVTDGVVDGNRSGVDNGWSEGAGLHFRRNATDHTDPTPVVVRGTTFTNNQGAVDLVFAGGDGGGFYTSGADGRMIPVLVEDCLFRDNFNLLGAGVYVSRWSEGTVRRCRFVENTAYFQGGGVFKGGALAANQGELLAIETCLFLRNRAGYGPDGEPTGDFALGGAVFCRMFPRVAVRHCTFIENRIAASSYSFGDAFAHQFEHGAWAPDMLCTVENSVFWGGGAHVQAYSSEGGLAAFAHNAAPPGALNLGGLEPLNLVSLAGSPFISLATGEPRPGGALVDRGLDLGFTLDLNLEPMPRGDGPDIGCFETSGEPMPTGRYHVQAGGVREFFPSTPGDWSPENCYADLAAALAVIAPGDTILLAHEDHEIVGTVALAAVFVADRDLATSPSGARLLLGADGGLTVAAPATAVTLQGLEFVSEADGRPLAAVSVTGAEASLWLTGCSFNGLTASGAGSVGGAALRVLAAGSVTVSSCHFSANTTTGGRGGSVFLGAGVEAEFADCVWESNHIGGPDARGGAVMIDSRAALSTATFTRCAFVGNTSGGPGGALSALSAAVTVIDGVVDGNRSGLENGWSEGAGLHVRRNDTDHTDPTPVVVRGSLFTGNQGDVDLAFAVGDGGGFYASGAAGRVVDVLIEDSTFRENYNLTGGGVCLHRFSEGTVRRCRFVENTAYFQGGGVFKGGALAANQGELLAIETCLFLRNRAGYGPDGEPTGDFALGGAVFCRMFPRVAVRHGTFIGNRIAASSYSFGDAFAHQFEHGAWEPDMLCTVENSVFWGGGAHVQAYSSEGGLAAFAHNAAPPGELNLGGLEPLNLVSLTESPFVSEATGEPQPGGALVDRGLDLGFTLDLNLEPMPRGDGPDIGCFESEPLPLGPAGQLLVRPNPARGEVRLRFVAAEEAAARLDILDLRGRRVRALWRGDLAAGAHAWIWDSRDDHDRACPAGVYMARLSRGDHTLATTKLLLMR